MIDIYIEFINGIFGENRQENPFYFATLATTFAFLLYIAGLFKKKWFSKLVLKFKKIWVTLYVIILVLIFCFVPDNRIVNLINFGKQDYKNISIKHSTKSESSSKVSLTNKSSSSSSNESEKTDQLDGFLIGNKPYVGEAKEIQELPTVSKQGTLTETDKEHIYDIPLQNAGDYFLAVEYTVPNVSSNLHYFNAEYNSYSYLSTNSLHKFDGGKEYKFKLSRSFDDTGYTFKIYSPKAIETIDGLSGIKDQFSFPGQTNKYAFTPQINGVYRLDFTDSNANTSFSIKIKNKNFEEIKTEYSNKKLNVWLEKGELYYFEINHSSRSEVNSYNMVIYYPKEVLDISNSKGVKDKIDFLGEEIEYQYIPSVSGKFNWGLTTNSKNNVAFEIYDKNDNKLPYEYSESGKGIYEMEKDTVYKVIVKHREGYDDYIALTPSKFKEISPFTLWVKE